MRIRSTIYLLAVLAAISFPAAGHGQWRNTSLAGASADHFENRASVAFRRSPWRGGLVGAGIGSGIGMLAFLVTSDGCWRRTESMCELSIPLYVGAGAAVGGIVGVLLGR